MNSNKTYGPMVSEKFRELSFPDMNETWPGMKAILDKEMPQEKKRRGLVWLPVTLVLSTAALLLVYFSYNQLAYSTGKEESFAQLKIDDIFPGQKAEADFDHNNQFPGWSYINSVKLNPLNDFESGKPGIMPKSIFENNIQPKYEASITPPVAILTDATTLKQFAEQELRASTAASATNNLLPSFDATVEPRHKQDATNNITLSGTAALQKDKKIDAATEETQITDAKLKKESSLTPDPLIGSPAVQPKGSAKNKGWVAGASVNYNLPVSQQEMSTVSVNGKKNALIDFLPSVYVQYHFTKKWYVETGFQFSSPQYTSNHKLASAYTDIDPNKKEENAVWLDKLYYINAPLSIHYRILPNLTIGSGIQYSYLRKSIFTDEVATWENGPAGWVKTSSQKEVRVKSNNGKSIGNGNSNGNGNGNTGNGNGNNGNGNGNNGNGNGNNGNGNGGSTNPAPVAATTQVDAVAQSIRSSDWRALFDVNYRWKRLNAGIRYNFGLNNYINTKSANTTLPVKDKNQSIQLYLRYDIFDKRKKK